jgi:hypothetical protein
MPLMAVALDVPFVGHSGTAPFRSAHWDSGRSGRAGCHGSFAPNFGHSPRLGKFPEAVVDTGVLSSKLVRGVGSQQILLRMDEKRGSGNRPATS